MDLYSVLGVDKSASGDEIKGAFRRKALQYHPDRHMDASPADKERAAISFKGVKDAYEVLSDGNKRALYDRLGKSFAASTSTSGHYSSYYYAARSTQGTQYQRQTYARPPGYHFVTAVLRHMTRVDGVFHVAMGATILFGFALAGSFADKLWEKNNEGRLFKHLQPQNSTEKDQSQSTGSSHDDDTPSRHPVAQGLKALHSGGMRHPLGSHPVPPAQSFASQDATLAPDAPTPVHGTSSAHARESPASQTPSSVLAGSVQEHSQAQQAVIESSPGTPGSDQVHLLPDTASFKKPGRPADGQTGVGRTDC